jgi:hypothetical protein
MANSKISTIISGVFKIEEHIELYMEVLPGKESEFKRQVCLEAVRDEMLERLERVQQLDDCERSIINKEERIATSSLR